MDVVGPSKSTINKRTNDIDELVHVRVRVRVFAHFFCCSSRPQYGILQSV